MRRFWGGIAGAAVLIVIAAAHFLADHGDEFISHLDAWVSEAEANVRDVDDGRVAATEFRVPPPVPLSDVAHDDRLGEVDGEQIVRSEGALEDSGIDSEQAEHLACFLTTKAVDGELSLEPEALEEEVFEYTADEVDPGPPQLAMREELEGFGETLESADSDGEKAFKGAMDFVCAVSEHKDILGGE